MTHFEIVEVAFKNKNTIYKIPQFGPPLFKGGVNSNYLPWKGGSEKIKKGVEVLCRDSFS